MVSLLETAGAKPVTEVDFAPSRESKNSKKGCDRNKNAEGNKALLSRGF